ncbi:TVP38/TMEM64 family protein [Sedimentitalea sp. XS_ASV28]|uniref:TVP38/TMEM64 family protein n=1 Tax=Sedimentitalea sp. XS_ASV28 TaxID=3241296 RepID=UPI003515413A
MAGSVSGPGTKSEDGTEDRTSPDAGRRRWRLVPALAALAVLAALYALLWRLGALDGLTDGPGLRDRVEGLGVFGPILIVVLLATAIVLNPIPSAPVAVASGAVYGHVWGTVYVVAGAEAGALIAFSIGRVVGQDVLTRWLGRRPSLGVLSSQNTLMAVVFFSRLLPFVSFDLVSYAAGLTPLTFWRFAVATLAGIIPASFLLAHFGGEMASENLRRAMAAVLALGIVTIAPILAKLMIDWRRSRRQPSTRREN